MAKVIRPTLVAAFADHSVQPAGRQCRERLQRLTDERQIGINQRLSRRRPDLRQADLRQHPPPPLWMCS
jgi:hypothetical protein